MIQTKVLLFFGRMDFSIGLINRERECTCCLCKRFVSRSKYEELQAKLKAKLERISDLLQTLDTMNSQRNDEVRELAKKGSVPKVPVAVQTTCPWWKLETWWDRVEREEREAKPDAQDFTCQVTMISSTNSVSTQTIISDRPDIGHFYSKLRKRTQR